jgi:hypothetical protein
MAEAPRQTPRLCFVKPNISYHLNGHENPSDKSLAIHGSETPFVCREVASPFEPPTWCELTVFLKCHVMNCAS